MQRIHILPEHEARKIAAGEVVERPASVVKELLENALDAGATDITLAVHDGGKKRISIQDNGCGMSPEDAVLSLEHHATSKIRSVDELTHVSTFGFRGEALSSIASVSNVQITTRRPEDELGFMIAVAHGTIMSTTSVAAPVGTHIIIEDLFDNVPARKKFLKQRDTEWRAIQQIVTAYALAFPVIGFTVRHDDVLIFTTPPSATLLTRAQQLFPRDVAENLITVEHSAKDVTLTGVITTHQVMRYDRRLMFSFVNQRWVKNNVLGKAIIAGYHNVLPTNKFPVTVMAITIPPEQVDINVHPRKEEVLLMHPQIMSAQLEKAVAQALSKSALQQQATYHVQRVQQTPAAVQHTHFLEIPSDEVTSYIPFVISKQKPVETQHFTHEIPVQHSVHHYEQKVIPHVAHGTTVVPVYEIRGQLHATYILVEVAAGLLIFDQHAAHEALLYDELCNTVSESVATKLLFPECITLEHDDVALLAPHLAQLRGLGIVAEAWDERHIMVTAVASLLQHVMVADIIQIVCAELRDGADAQMVAAKFHEQARHKLFAMAACKKAVKAGDVLSREEMNKLVHRCMTTPNLLTCPHGRPISWTIGKFDLEKWFKRA